MSNVLEFIIRAKDQTERTLSAAKTRLERFTKGVAKVRSLLYSGVAVTLFTKFIKSCAQASEHSEYFAQRGKDIGDKWKTALGQLGDAMLGLMPIIEKVSGALAKSVGWITNGISETINMVKTLSATAGYMSTGMSRQDAFNQAVVDAAKEQRETRNKPASIVDESGRTVSDLDIAREITRRGEAAKRAKEQETAAARDAADERKRQLEDEDNAYREFMAEHLDMYRDQAEKRTQISEADAKKWEAEQQRQLALKDRFSRLALDVDARRKERAAQKEQERADNRIDRLAKRASEKMRKQGLGLTGASLTDAETEALKAVGAGKMAELAGRKAAAAEKNIALNVQAIKDYTSQIAKWGVT